MAAFSLKIAPKHDTKICYPSIAAVTAEMGGFLFKEAHQITKIGRKGRETAACCPATLNVPPEMVFHSTETIKATIVYFKTGSHIISRWMKNNETKTVL